MHSSLIDQAIIPQGMLYDANEDFLRRTIDVKNKNIDDLLKELKETQNLYQQYKLEYLASQKKLKTKVLELTESLSNQGSELEGQRQLSSRLKSELQALHEKQQQLIQNHLLQSKEQHALRKQLEDKYRDLLRQNTSLKHKNQDITNRYVNLEERYLQSERTTAGCREQLRLLKEEFEANKMSWLQERRELMNRLEHEEAQKKSKQKVNRKLDMLEQRILETMRKI